MRIDYKTGQLKGPFEADINILEQISSDIGKEGWIKHLGIQAWPETEMIIDGNIIEMGKTGLYEVGENIKVTSLKFVKPQTQRTLVEYVYEYK